MFYSIDWILFVSAHIVKEIEWCHAYKEKRDWYSKESIQPVEIEELNVGLVSGQQIGSVKQSENHLVKH